MPVLAQPAVLAVAALVTTAGAGATTRQTAEPYFLPLRREEVPIMRGGRFVSHRSAYYGTVSIGGPERQEFSVVFDTGSGHVVVPSVDCSSTACLHRRRYNASRSTSALAVNTDGQPVPPDELCDQVTIGFGTGTVLGELARERVCVGPGQGIAGEALRDSTSKSRSLCSSVTIVMAVEMSEQPFGSLHFDGLFGLGLGGLALGPGFSFFGSLAASSGRQFLPHFGIFLAGTEGGEGSEITFGGHNAARLRAPLVWEPVAAPGLGYWQVRLRAVRVGGREVPACQGGTCRAVLDTGTSRLGAPLQHLAGLEELLSVMLPTGLEDCRYAPAPVLSFELENFTISLRPQDYFRPASVLQHGTAANLLAGGANATRTRGTEHSRGTRRPLCRPRLMPVSLEAPLGPDVFIFGEPVLQRYYTVYDWNAQRVGFAASQPLSLTPAVQKAASHEGDEEVAAIALVQVSLSLVVWDR